MNRMRGVLAVMSIGILTLAACASTGSPTATANSGNGGNSGNNGGGGGLVFNGQVNLTGAIPVQGSFTDNQGFSFLHSCTDFAANGSTALGGWVGPDAGTVAGHDVQWSLELATAKFHGPGTYSDSAGLFTTFKIDDDLFGGGTTSVTINADGSGSAQLANDSGNPGQTESGTITWTCTGG